jgi:hypothetical protein
MACLVMKGHFSSATSGVGLVVTAPEFDAMSSGPA